MKIIWINEISFKKEVKRLLLLMKITLIILFICIFQLQAVTSYGQNTQLSLNVEEASLSEIFNKIEKQSEFLFNFKDSDINHVTVKINIKNGKIEEILSQVLKNTDLTFSINDRHITIFRQAQAVKKTGKIIRGSVKDNNGEPLLGVSVLIKGTSLGTVTDIDGNYSIEIPNNQSTLIFSYLGYKSKELSVSGTQLDVILSEDTHTLDEVVVVGFGTQKKVNLTGSIAVVNEKDLASRPVANVTQALQGLVPGMNFDYGKGGAKVGSVMNINIRGTGTLDTDVAKATPLVLIDGLEGDMNTLNPNDIESISVLKDAAASSIYGSRAPYGVILVTTKKGKQGRTNINYNNNFRWSQAINMPKPAVSIDYAKYLNQIAINDGSSPEFNAEHLALIQGYLDGTNPNSTFPDPTSPNIWYWEGNANVDWIEEIFGGTGFSQEHSLSVNGGTEKCQYYLSANYMKQDGVIRYGNEDMQRYNFTGKINAQLFPWLKANYAMRFIRKDLDQPRDLNNDLYYYNVMRRWATEPLLDPNGNYLTGLTKSLMWYGNNKYQTDWMYQQLQLELEPVKNWKTFVDVNYKTTNLMGDEITYKVPSFDVDGNLFYYVDEKSSIYTDSERTNFFNTNIYSEYMQQIKDHTIKGMVGFQAETSLWKRVGAKKEDLITESITDINAAIGQQYTYGTRNHWATAGFFGRINYDYLGRYLLEVNLRYDGTSRFAADRRWHLFPSFSAGWNIAREAFMEPFQDVVNTLKFRGSWGQLGNQNTVNLYPYIQTMPFYPSSDTDNSWLIGGERQNGSTSPSLISKTLTWETMSSWNVGFDLGMARNRLNISFDYFVRKTLDMVGPASELPFILGTAVPKTNNADMQSAGFELDVAWRDQVDDFRYGVHFLLSDDRQKVLKYPNESGSLSTWREGEYLNEIWGLTTIGIAKSQEEMDKHLASLPNGGQNSLGTSTWLAGDIMYADLNGDGKITTGNTVSDPGDRKIIGNSTPRFKFGLDIDAAWKGFDIRLFFQGIAKRDWSFGAGHLVYWGNAGGIWNSAMFETNYDFYRPEDDGWLGANLDAKYPRLTASGKNREAQTGYLENAAYIRLKNLQLGYTLPNVLTRKAGISNFRIFFSAENVFTLTGLPRGIEPETLGIGGYGNGSGSYPLTRTFSTGISVNF